MSNTQRGDIERTPTEKSGTDTTDSRDSVDVHPTDLTQFQENILAILAEETRYGLAIKRDLEEYYSNEVNHGRLYPNLDQLVEKGLVEKSELDKRTNQYKLTDAGRDVLGDRAEWLLRHLNAERKGDQDFERVVLQLTGGAE